MKIKSSISISRPFDGREDHISIRIDDRASGITFFEGTIAPADFARALTGLAHMDFTEAEVRGLQNVGKHRESKDVSIEYVPQDEDGQYPKREVLEQFVREHGKVDGWHVDPYLGSQRSVVRHDGKTTLNYRIVRWVETSD